jgi:excisionase family DNA binding protein
VGGEIFLTLSEVQDRLGVSEAEVRRLVSEGALKAYRSGSRSLYRAKEVATLANKSTKSCELVLGEDAFEPESESEHEYEGGETSTSMLESLDTTSSGSMIPRVGRTSFFTDQLIRKLMSRRPGRLISTTIFGWIILGFGVAGIILGIHRIQQSMILTQAKELTLAVAVFYLFIKICLTLTGLLTLIRSSRAIGFALVTLFLAILEVINHLY